MIFAIRAALPFEVRGDPFDAICVIKQPEVIRPRQSSFVNFTGGQINYSYRELIVFRFIHAFGHSSFEVGRKAYEIRRKT